MNVAMLPPPEPGETFPDYLARVHKGENEERLILPAAAARFADARLPFIKLMERLGVDRFRCR